MAVPRTYVLPESLVVPKGLTPRIHALLSPGRQRIRNDGRTLPDDLLVWLSDLDRFVAEVAGEPSAKPQWLTTRTAAARLGIGERAMRSLGDRMRWTSRTVRGKREWLEADLLAEIELRNTSEHG